MALKHVTILRKVTLGSTVYLPGVAIIDEATIALIAAGDITVGVDYEPGVTGGGSSLQFLFGTDAPDGGADGDVFFVTGTGGLYKKVSGSWVLLAILKGADGVDGADGAGGGGFSPVAWMVGDQVVNIADSLLRFTSGSVPPCLARQTFAIGSKVQFRVGLALIQGHSFQFGFDAGVAADNAAHPAYGFVVRNSGVNYCDGAGVFDVGHTPYVPVADDLFELEITATNFKYYINGVLVNTVVATTSGVWHLQFIERNGNSTTCPLIIYNCLVVTP